MKKYILLALLVFFFSYIDVFAYNESKLTCRYNDSSGNTFDLEVDFTTLGGDALEGVRASYYKDLGNGSEQAILDLNFYSNENPDANASFINLSSTIQQKTGLGKGDTRHIYVYKDVFNKRIGTVNNTDQNSNSLCPEQVFIVGYEEKGGIIDGGEITDKYDIFACGIDYANNLVNTCDWTKGIVNTYNKTANYDGTAGKIYTLDFFTSTIYNKENANSDNETTDIGEQANSIQERIDKYCNEELDTYDEAECEKAQAEKEMLDQRASDDGYDASALYQAYKDALGLDFSTGECDSYLGNVNTEGTPAYMLNFVFNVMKYIAIVLLFVFTIIELAKSVADGKDETRKKATQNIIKRLIIAIVIFFLPLLINFVLSLLGVVTISEACNVGAAPISESVGGE